MPARARGRASTCIRTRGTCSAVMNEARSADEDGRQPARTALILYGSETGNAQDVAEEVGRMAERLRFDTTIADLDSVQLRDVLKYTMVIFAISTTGQGEMPQNARKFWKTLLSGALKPGVLRRLRFTSFGLGDSSYARYNVAHRMLCGRLVQLGASAFCERGEGNEQHPEGHSAGLREWVVGLKDGVLKTFPLPDGVEPRGDDEFLKPKWKLALQPKSNGSSDGPVTNGHGEFADSAHHDHDAVGLPHRSKDKQDSGKATAIPSAKPGNDQSPSIDPLPVKDTYLADIVANERITSVDHFQDVRLLDLRLDRNYSYGPGAVAVIYPKNFPADVDEFIKLMHWGQIADQPLDLIATSPVTAGKIAAMSPLKRLPLTKTTLTLRWLLENVLDIMSIPRRSFFANLAYFAGTKTEDEQYQKERLLELANPELIDELWDYTTRPKRTILEVMMDFTTIQIPWQYALSALPLMRGRQFSIASGGELEKDAEGRTRVQLLVAIADPPSPIIKWRRRYGVCTRYIVTLQPGQQISLGMQQGYLDVQPDELKAPVVMVGPGTGLAPMRAMVHQRCAWAEELGFRAPGQRLKDDILFFGCRSAESDYFFREEWERFAETEGLQVCTAFSRDKGRPRQYVQDLIRDNAERVFEAMHEQNGKIYICGSSGNMPKGVREALLDVLVEKGKGMSREEAEGYLDRMEKDGRYKQETW